MGLISFFQRNRQDRERPGAVSADPNQVELVRARARRRLIGAAVLVMAAVVGLPMLLDTTPRQLPANIAVDIGRRDAAGNVQYPAQATHPDSAVAPAAVTQAVPSVKPDASRVAQTAASAVRPKETASRFVVQVGAFEQTSAARDMRTRVEKLGLSTYEQVIDSPSGKRIRVRLGPFGSREEADKAAAKVRANGMSASVLAL